MSNRTCFIECTEAIRPAATHTASGCPRNFLDNRFVYVVFSPRARGLAVGINLNPDKRCNFECVYCEVDRHAPPLESKLDIDVMIDELQKTLHLIRSGEIRERAAYQTLNDNLLKLRHVAFSGDGEPTLSPLFADVVEAAVHVRARDPRHFFKFVLLTNGTGLDSSGVQSSFKYFTSDDEIWVKLDAGSQEYMEKVNRTSVSLEKVLQNIFLTARERPVVIQTLFPLISGQEPAVQEIDQYIQRLKQLKDGGARIALVQIYSATRPTPRSEYGHLPLKTLARICQRIRTESGLKAEVY
jgi:wyosine [tRNA(Phe)-imidazoG37] synthetase (radical SAM superfamily)